MTADSAVAQDFETRREYVTGDKIYFFPEIGCVATWGERLGNQIGKFLWGEKEALANLSIDDLAELVYTYLTEEYDPKARGLGEVGYHMCGYDEDGRARAYHIFWGFDRPFSSSQRTPKYEKYTHNLPPGGSDHKPPIIFLYNGRNDLAHVVIQTILEQVRENPKLQDQLNVIRYQLGDPLDRVMFSDFVVRFAAEITPEVGPPFTTVLISPPDNKYAIIQNETFCPLDPREVELTLWDLDPRYRFRGYPGSRHTPGAQPKTS